MTVELDRRVGSYNTLTDLSNKVCIPNRAEDLNLNVFNMVTQTNELTALAKHIYKSNIDLMKKNVIQTNGEIMINVDVSVKTP